MPICSVARSRYVVESPPLGADGVPTHTIVMSLAITADTGCSDAVKWPEATTSAVNSPMRSSKIGAVPCRMKAVFCGFESTPITE